jgi:DHA2 family multidrug resistance protein-like MFS transporter
MAREGVAAGAALVGAGVATGAVLVYRELRIPTPLVPIDLLRIPIFGLSIATAIISFCAQMLAFVGLPFYLQGTLGRTAVETGLLMTPLPLALALGAPLGGRFADRYPAGTLGALGLAVFALGLLMLALLPAHPSNFNIVWPLVLCGLGFGFFQTPNNRTMVHAAPMHRSGAAGGMLGIARVVGQTSGAVGMAMFFRLAGTQATKASLFTAAAIAAVAMVMSLSRLSLTTSPKAPAGGAPT